MDHIKALIMVITLGDTIIATTDGTTIIDTITIISIEEIIIDISAITDTIIIIIIIGCIENLFY